MRWFVQRCSCGLRGLQGYLTFMFTMRRFNIHLDNNNIPTRFFLIYPLRLHTSIRPFIHRQSTSSCFRINLDPFFRIPHFRSLFLNAIFKTSCVPFLMDSKKFKPQLTSHFTYLFFLCSCAVSYSLYISSKAKYIEMLTWLSPFFCVVLLAACLVGVHCAG